MQEVKIWWLKSKLFLVNLITALLSSLYFFIDEIKEMLGDNVAYFKEVLSGKTVLIILIILSVVNAISKTSKNQSSVVLKKKNDNCTKKKKANKNV